MIVRIPLNGEEKYCELRCEGESFILLPTNRSVEDAPYFLSGFVDIHMHGYGGFSGINDDLDKLSIILAKKGVVGFVLSLVTMSKETTKEYLQVLSEWSEKNLEGAEFLGVHLEGPWINKEKAGAQEIANIRSPDIDELREYLKIFPRIVMLTVAPEVPGALSLITWAASRGITVAVGHSNGTYTDAIAAWNAGATHATHLYNAMRGFHHREPGILGGILDMPFTVELILDGIHIHPAAARLAYRIKTPTKIALVTDAIPAAGLPPGPARLGNVEVEIRKDGRCVIKGTDTLAGSTLSMDRNARNAMIFLGANLWEINMITHTVPLKILGKKCNPLFYGPVKNGVILDSRFNVLATIVRGRVVYNTGILV